MLDSDLSKFIMMEDIGSFFTGLSNRLGTKPGFKISNHKYSVKFESIECENKSEDVARFLKDRFESCYNWEDVMEMILECLEFYYDEEDFQVDLQSSIKAWLSEHEDWGLLFTLLPMDFQKLLLVLYFHLSVKNHQENLEKTNEELFDDLMALYENETQGLPLSDLVPKIEARLLNIIAGPKQDERRKILRIKFLSCRFQLVANFSVEKKRIRSTLVEHAAEVVGRMVDDSEDLEIPETLKPLVSEKIIDADWVASYWWAKFRHQEMESKAKLINDQENSDKSRMVQTSIISLIFKTFFSSFMSEFLNLL